MKKIILLPLLLLSFAGFAQADKQNMKVATNAEPVYPKGDSVLYSYVLGSIKYPDEAIKKYVVGEVTLSFDVQADGALTNVVVIGDVGYGIGDQVKALLEKLKFNPGVQNGVRIKMNETYTFPIKAH